MNLYCVAFMDEEIHVCFYFQGIHKVGDFGTVWEVSKEQGRLEMWK